MLQDLLPLLPNQATTAAHAAVIIGALLGLSIWLTGARCSRAIVTLIAVTAGGAAGMIVPRLLGYDINTSASAIAGALVCGFSGFLMHRVWVGMGLGLMLAVWAAVVIWLAYRNGAAIDWPTDAANVHEWVKSLWTSLPAPVTRMLPYGTATACIIGLMIALFWPRVGTVLLYSVVGVSLVTAMVLWAIESKQMDWPRFLPAQTNMQAALLAGLITLGVLIQWQFAMRRRRAPTA